MQEDQFAVPFLGAEREVGHPRQAALQLSQLVVVRGEEAAAAVRPMQGLRAGPGDGQAIPGRRTAPDLVQDHQGARGRLGQDGGGLDHLGHEGRPAPGQVVARPDPAEQAVDHAQLQASGGNRAPRLGEHRQQGVLSQEGRLARHVRAGDDGQPRGRHGLAVEPAVIGREGAARATHRRLDHRMAGALGLEGGAAVQLRPDGPGLLGPLGQGGGDVQAGAGRRSLPQGIGGGADQVPPGLECGHLDGQGPFARLGDPRVQLGQGHRREPHLAGQGLAMDEGGVQGRAQQGLGRLGRGLDEIAQHPVMPDLQGDAALLGQLSL